MSSFSSAFNKALKERGYKSPKQGDFNSQFNAAVSNPRKEAQPLVSGENSLMASALRMAQIQEAERQRRIARYNSDLDAAAKRRVENPDAHDRYHARKYGVDVADLPAPYKIGDPRLQTESHDSLRGHDSHASLRGAFGATESDGTATSAYMQKRANDIRSELKGIDTEIKNAKTEVKRNRALTGGLTNPVTASNAKARMDEANAKIPELEARRSQLIDDLHQYGDAYGAKDLGKTAWSDVWYGMSNMETRAYRGLDFLNRLIHEKILGWTPEEYDNTDTFTKDLLKHGEGNVEYWEKRGSETRRNTKAAEVGSKIVSGTVEAIPYALMAILSAGSSGALSAAQGISGAGATSATLANIGTAATTTGKIAGVANSARLGIVNMLKDPQYWATVLMEIGDDYTEARADGAEENRAILYATVTALVNSIVEIGGGGIQELPQELRHGGRKAIQGWVDTMLDEGKEEGVQGFISRSFQTLYGKQNELFSMTNPDAIINPRVMGEEMFYGAAIGGVMGGGEVATNAIQNSVVNRVNNNRQKAGAAYAAYSAGRSGVDFNTFVKENAEQLKNFSTKELSKLIEANEAGLRYSEKSNSQVRDVENVAKATMGPNGQLMAMTYYRRHVNNTKAADYYNAANEVYQQGRTGAEMHQTDTRVMSQNEAERWYNAGRKDTAAENAMTREAEAKARAEEQARTEAQAKAEAAVPAEAPAQANVEIKEGANQDAEQVRTEPSSDAGDGRVDGLDAAKQGVRLAEGPAAAVQEDAGRRSAGAQNTEETAQQVEEQRKAAETLAADAPVTSSAEQNIQGGTDYKTFRVIDDSTYDMWTPKMKRIVKNAKRHGVTVHWYVGKMFIDEGNGAFAVRGLNTPGGNDIWLRADAYADIEAISLHELFHTAERRNPGLKDEIRKKITEGKEDDLLLAMIRKYQEKYRGAKMTDDEILSEIFADAYAGIDIFANTTPKAGASPEENVRASQFYSVVREAYDRTMNGPPAEGQNAASRESMASRESYIPPDAQETMDKYGMVERDLAVVSPSVARVMDSPDYHPPVSVSDLASMASHDTMPEWTQQYLYHGGSEENAQSIQDFDDHIWKSMAGQYTNEQLMLQLMVPAGHVDSDAYGPLRSNVEYVWTFDMDTSCPRSFQFVAYRNAIQRRIHRTLTFEESINLINLMAAYKQMIPCTYCYVENKRILKASYYNNFYGYHKAVMDGIANHMDIADLRPKMYGWDAKKKKLTKAAEETLHRWMEDKSGYNPTIEENYKTVNLIRNAALQLLDDMMDAGKITADTTAASLTNIIANEYGIKSDGALKEVEKMANDWRYDAGRGAEHTTFIDDTDETFDPKIADRALELDHEAVGYSNSASSAKTVENYVPYNGNIRNVKAKDKEYINGMGGIRKHSSNDFRIDYVLDYFQFFADLALENWKGHTYTKNADYVRIFGRTGDMINMSIAFNDSPDGGVSENVNEGMEHKLAKELAENYDNAGVMAMVTSDRQLSYALNCGWVDMIIPFHHSGLPKSVWYNMKAWLDYTAKQNEKFYDTKERKDALKAAGVKTTGLKAAQVKQLFNDTFGIIEVKKLEAAKKSDIGKPFEPHFYPFETVQNGVKIPGHNNSKAKYMELCKQYGVHPRFDGVIVQDADGNDINVVDHPNYMMLVKETARATENFEQPVIQFSFNQADPYLTSKYGEAYGKKSVTPMDYAMAELTKAATQFGKPETAAAQDPLRIVNQFIEEYAGKNREIGWVSEHTDNMIESLENAEFKIQEAYRKQLLEQYKKTEEENKKNKKKPVRSNFYTEEAQKSKASREVDIDDFTSDEAKEKYANDPRFKDWTHKDLAWISAASLAQVPVPEEMLLAEPKIAEAQRRVSEKVVDSLTKYPHGSNKEVDAKRYQVKDRLLSLGSFVKKGNYSGPTAQERKAFIVLGPPAAGKSRVFADPLSRDNKAKIIDSDTVKEWLDGYDNGWGAGYVHEESSMITKWALDEAIDKGYNIVIPKVGGKSIDDIVSQLKDNGYHVGLYLNDVAEETSTTRMASRFADEGRWINLEVLHNVGTKPTDTLMRLADQVDYVEWRNNDVGVGEEPRLIWKTGDSEEKLRRAGDRVLGRENRLGRGTQAASGSGSSGGGVQSAAPGGQPEQNINIDREGETQRGTFMPKNQASRENLNDDYTRPTDKIQLNEKQLKNRKKTIDNDVVGSTLFTLAGGKIERYKGVVGKALDGAKGTKQVYIHKSAVADSIVPAKLYADAAEILKTKYPDFQYNAVMYDTGKPGVLRFDEAKDFDTEREPTVGYQVTVDTEANDAKMSKNPSNTIWHHKWLWVKPDYRGFDHNGIDGQEEAWRWSQLWLSTITKMDKSTDLKYGGLTYNGIANGTHVAAWNEQLDQFNLPHDKNVRNMASMDTDAMDRIAEKQTVSSEDTSIPQVATTFTHFLFNPTDRILDYGGGQYNIAQRAMKKIYGDQMTFEIIDLFNRSKAHNLRIFEAFEKNKADAITINNVLNVIDTYEARQAVLDTASRYIKPGGLVYLCFYEGNGDDAGSSAGAITKANKGNEKRSSYQTKMPTEAYMDEVLQVFPYAKLIGGDRFIIASDHDIQQNEYVYDSGIKQDVTRAIKEFNDDIKAKKDYVSYRYAEMTPAEIDEKYLEATEVNPKTGKRDESAIKGIVEHIARREGLSEAETKQLLKVKQDKAGNVVPISQRLEMHPDNFTKYSREDSDGDALSDGQVEFFADSEVRDQAGRLRKVYHGTTADFNEFDIERYGTANGHPEKAIFFTNLKRVAKQFAHGGTVKEYYLNITNPLDLNNLSEEQINQLAEMDNSGLPKDEVVRFIKSFVEAGNGYALKTFVDYSKVPSLGYDGVIVRWNSDYQIKQGADPDIYEYAAFQSSQAKNTDNKNPTGVNDTRYSREVDNRLEQENIDLRKRLDEALADTKLTRGWRAATKDVQRVAADIIEATSSKESPAIVEQKIRSLVEAASNGGITSDEMKDLALDIARGLVRRSSVLTTKDATSYDAMRKYLKSIYIKVPSEMRKEFTDWKAFSAAHKAMRMKLDGVGIDAVYAELQKQMGDAYFPDLSTDMEKLQQIAEILDNLTPVYDNPYSVNMAEAAEETANAILDSILDIGQAAPTYADQAKAREENVRSLYQQKLAAQKEYLQQRIQDEADLRKEQTTALRKHYADVRKNKQLRKQESAARQKLLRVAKRLQNAKLTAVNRANIKNLIGDLDTVAVGITGRSIENLSALQKWYNDQKQNNPDFIPDAATEARLQRLSNRHISDMTLDEVRDLTAVLQNIENAIRTQRKMIADEDYRDTHEMVAEAIEDVRATKGTKKSLIDYIVTNSLSPTRLIRRLVGYVDSDPMYRRAQELADGQRKAFDYEMRAEKLFSKWTNDTKLMKRLTSEKTVDLSGYSNGKPVTVKITPDMRMALYLHSLNAQNMKHIANGGVTIPDIDLYLKGELAEAYSRGTTIKLTPNAVRGLIAKMSPEERAFATRAHDYFNGMSRNEINAVSEQLVGYSLADVKDYFPIETDRNFTKADIGELKRDGTIEGMGFLKERVNASNPINLVPLTDVLKKSIKNHAKYVGMAIPVRNFSKIWGMTDYDAGSDSLDSLRAAVGSRWGDRAVKYVEKMVADLQNKKSDTDDAAQLFNKIRSNYAGAVLSLNASVAMKQAASYPTAAAVLGWGPLARAMADVGRVDLDLIAKYTPLQWYRSQGYSSQELGDIKKQQGLMDKAMKAKATVAGYDVPVLNWIQGMDLLTTRKLWKASEYYVQENQKGLRVGSDEYYQAVADIYNRVIEETQPNYTVMQRPQLLRTNNALLQSVTMFKTQPLQNFNVLYDAIGELAAAERRAKNGDSSMLKQARKNAVNAVTSQVAQLALFAAMTMAWNLLRRRKDKYADKDGNVTPWSAAAGIGKDMISGAASMVLLGSEVYNLLNSLFTGDKYYGSSSVTISAVSDAATALLKGANTIKDAVSALAEGKSIDPKKFALDINDTVKEVSKILGLPVENVENIVEIIFAQTAMATAGKYAGGYLVLKYTNNLSSTYVKGDVYDLLWGAYKNSPEQYNTIINDLISSGEASEKNLRDAMEKRMKEEQGVTEVEDLDQRWMMPAQQSVYDNIMSGVRNTGIYAKANADQIDALESAMYAYAIKDSTGEAISDKISGGSSVGLNEKEYFQYALALKVADTPNKNGKLGGAPTNEEAENAIRMVDGLSDAERSYLWSLTQNEKSDPFLPPPKTETKASTKKTETKKETPKQEEKPKKETANVSGSSAISAASYDPETGIATITWRGGRTYSYPVTASEWEAFKAADSKGSYVNKNWKGK